MECRIVTFLLLTPKTVALIRLLSFALLLILVGCAEVTPKAPPPPPYANATLQAQVLAANHASLSGAALRDNSSSIEQLLSNLLTNSIRYTDAPGSIAVDWHSDGRLLTLTVDDSAPGVSPADLRELFEPLFRGDRARQRGTLHRAEAVWGRLSRLARLSNPPCRAP